jgi:hypothetical protein
VKITEQSPLEQAARGIATDTVRNRIKAGTSTALLSLGLTLGTPAMATESPYLPMVGNDVTELVINASVVQKDLFAAFDRNNKSEKREDFAKLSPESQKKVLSFYQMGKGEQSNEKHFLKEYTIISGLSHDSKNAPLGSTNIPKLGNSQKKHQELSLPIEN